MFPKSLRMWFQLKLGSINRIDIVFTLALLSLCFSVFLSFDNSALLYKTLDQRTDVMNRRLLLEELFETVLDAETNQRGYLLTGDPALLRPFEEAKEKFKLDFTELRRLHNADKQHLERIERLHSVFEQRFSLLSAGIELKRDGKFLEAIEIVRTGRGREVMSAIRSNISEIRDLEETLWIAKVEDTFAAVRIEQNMKSFATALGALILLISWFYTKKASRMKSDFLSTVSHEIRTPVNGVMGMANVLLDTPLNDEQRDYTKNIVRSADTLLVLINDILDLSKVEAGKIDIESVDFELNQIIDDVEKTLAFAAREKGLKLITSLAPNLPQRMKGDPTRIRQVLINLVSNAIKFTKIGHVNISISGEAETNDRHTLFFQVEDTGIGIPKEALGRMFQSFSQADTSTTRRFGGTGLGLSISKRLVHLMGGKIGVRSKEGEGSVFWFTLELERSIEPINPQAIIEEPKIQFPNAKFRILLADDNSVNQLIAVKMLQKLGHSVLAVGNGNEVIDALRLTDYDLVFMDCQMPDMDGYEATKMIRTSPSLSCNDIPIIAMTANAMSGDREKCLAAGMDDYISKPIKSKDLESAIGRTISNKHLAAS